jgi:hypothetical protein
MNSTVPKAVQSCHELLAWIIPHLDKFPRARRFTLGERIEVGLLQVLELLIEAAYQSKKGELLNEANRKLAVIKHLWRLAFELLVIAPKSYEFGSGLLMGLGAQIGGWRKQSQNK